MSKGKEDKAKFVRTAAIAIAAGDYAGGDPATMTVIWQLAERLWDTMPDQYMSTEEKQVRGR